MKKAINILEIIFILYLVISSIGKRNIIEFTPDFVQYSENVVYSRENGSYTITHAENVGPEGYSMLGNGAMTIAPGAYEIEIRYSSQREEGNPWGNCQNKAGWTQIRSYANPQSVQVNPINLVDGSTLQRDRMWITSLSDVTDLDFRIFYAGTGSLTIESVVVQELMIWRLTRILIWIFLFGLGEAGYYYFFSKKTFADKKYAGGLIVIILGASLPAFCSFIIGGHDLMFHLGRILSLGQSIQAGDWWNPIDYNMVNGYGYATPLFYPQLFLYLPALLYNMALPVHICYQIYVVCINIATCLICYWCIHKLCKDKDIALFGSFLYLFSAYRMANVYVRAALGEFTAMAFLPLLVYGFIKVYSTQPKEIKAPDYLPIVIGLTGLIQSHILSCELSAIIILIACLLLVKKTFQPYRFLALSKAAGLTLLLNLGFITAFLDSMRMNVQVKTENVSTIQGAGAYLIQLLGIFMTPDGLSNEKIYGDMPLCLGLSLVLGLLLFGWCYSKRYDWQLEQDSHIRTGRILSVLAVISILFSLALFPWDSIAGINFVFGKLASVIQFPWRYLVLATVFCVFVTVIGIHILKKKEKRLYSMGFAALIGLLTLLNTGLLYMQYADTSPTTRMFAAMDNWDSIIYIYGGEYLLEGTDTLQCVTREISTDAGAVSVTDYDSENGFTSFVCVNQSSQEKQVTLPLFHYDNYRIYDRESGQKLEAVTGHNNRISVTVPGNYEGTVCLQYAIPLLWKIAYMVSLVTLLCIILPAALKYHVNLLISL